MQLELLRGLSRLPGVKVECLSLVPVATFPREKRTWIRSSQVEVVPGVQSTRPGFLTLPLVKQVSQILSMAGAAKRAVQQEDYDYVLTFNMFPHVGVAAWWLRRVRGMRVACLLADPPVQTRTAKNWATSQLLRLMDGWTRRLLRVPGHVIALTEKAAQDFTPHAKILVMDGAIVPPKPPSEGSPNEVHATDHEGRGCRVVFTGALTSYNGIRELVDAIPLVSSPGIEFHLYGSGELSAFVEEASAALENLMVHGHVDSTAMSEVQQDAFLLINPRQINHPVSDVTFPSKVLEYMVSGTPVLSTRLRCFSSEYDGCVFFAETGSPEDLAERIDTVAGLPSEERSRVGSAGREFVLLNRTWEASVRRIYEFLREK